MSVETNQADGLGRIVLSEPPLNILTRRLLAEMRDALAELASEPSLRVLLVSATGKHFSAGADVGEHLPPQYEDLIPEFLDTVFALATFPVPVVAAVQGRCLGGGFEMALAADMIVAAEGASFGQPEIALGVLPPAACVFLPLWCGRGRAADLIYSGEAINAVEAERAGLAQKVVPDDSLQEAALQFADRFTRHSAAALRVAKRMLRGGDEEALRASLSRVGRMYSEDLMRTRDAIEGLQAFMEKRRPAWSHE